MMLNEIKDNLMKYSVEPCECRYEVMLLVSEYAVGTTEQVKSFKPRTYEAITYFTDRHGLYECLITYLRISDKVGQPCKRNGVEFFHKVSVYFNDKELGHTFEISL